MDPPSSGKSKLFKQSGFSSRKSGYFVQDKGLASIFEARPRYYSYSTTTSHLAAGNASSSAGTGMRLPTYLNSLPLGAVNASYYSGNYTQVPPSTDLYFLTGCDESTSLPDCNASYSEWNFQASYLNYLASFAYNANAQQKLAYYNFLARSALASIAEDAGSSATAAQMQQHGYYKFLPCSNCLASKLENANSSAVADAEAQQPSYYTFLPCNGLGSISENVSSSAGHERQGGCFNVLSTGNKLSSLSVADKASSSTEKKQAGESSFLTKPLPENFVFKARSRPVYEISPPKEREPRYDLKDSILPDACLRCRGQFKSGEGGGYFFYKDQAYCSWDCRQVLIDIDYPDIKENPTRQVKIEPANKKRKSTPAPRS